MTESITPPAGCRRRARPGPRAAHLGPERRRPMVLDAAFELFLEHGYEGTSMEAIARGDRRDQAGRLRLLSLEGGAVQRAARPRGGAGADRDRRRAARTPPRATSRPRWSSGLTAFLRAVEASPDAYRVIFLGEGANAAVARRIQRGRERQVEAVAMLARPLLGATDEPELDRSARLVGHLTVGLAEAGARALLERARLDSTDPGRQARPDGGRRQRGAGVSAMSPLRAVATLLKVVLAVVAVIVFGAGVPFVWIWIGSQLQGGTAPSFGGIGVALLGIIGSYALLSMAFAWAKDRFDPQEGPVRHAWNRSLSAERRRARRRRTRSRTSPPPPPW